MSLLVAELKRDLASVQIPQKNNQTNPQFQTQNLYTPFPRNV